MRGDVLQIEGYASVFNVRDRGGDVVLKGAFSSAVSSFGTKIPLFLEHKTAIGKAFRVVEDDVGLRVTGWCLPVLGNVSGQVYLSIAYIARSFSRDALGRTLKSVQLFEISVVEEPMNLMAVASISPRRLDTLPTLW